MSSKKDQQQILQSAFDEVSSALAVKLTATQIAISTDAGEDSVKAYGEFEPNVAPGTAMWNYMSQALSVGDTVVTKTYRTGGPSGTVVGTVVLTYADNTRGFLVSCLKS
jgi:cell shape-determining protein MreC